MLPEPAEQQKPAKTAKAVARGINNLKAIGTTAVGLVAFAGALLQTKTEDGLPTLLGWFLIGITAFFLVVGAVIPVRERNKERLEELESEIAKQKELNKSLEEQRRLYGEFERVRNPLTLEGFLFWTTFEFGHPDFAELRKSITEILKINGEDRAGKVAAEAIRTHVRKGMAYSLSIFQEGNDSTSADYYAQIYPKDIQGLGVSIATDYLFRDSFNLGIPFDIDYKQSHPEFTSNLDLFRARVVLRFQPAINETVHFETCILILNGAPYLNTEPVMTEDENQRVFTVQERRRWGYK